MIDPNFLRSLGWSDELIGAATLMSERVAKAAVVGTVGLALDVAAGLSTRGSDRADVSGPAVATPQLRIGPV
jgi:hypothetical protein